MSKAAAGPATSHGSEGTTRCSARWNVSARCFSRRCSTPVCRATSTATARVSRFSNCGENGVRQSPLFFRAHQCCRSLFAPRVQVCSGPYGLLAPMTDVRHPTRSPMRGLHAVAPICGGRRRSRSLKRYSAPSAPIADARGTREGEPRAVSQRCDAVSLRTASRRLPATVLPPHDASPSMWA